MLAASTDHESMDPGQTPLVGVAISTHNRSTGVEALLTALERQSLPAEQFEVVVVDDGSTGHERQALMSLARRSSMRVRVIYNEENRGAASGRNLAWRACRAPVVAFTDDDCQPAPGWLERGLATLDAATAVVVGRTEPNPEQRSLDHPLARTMRVNKPDLAPTCNVFYLREDLAAVEGFDESFGRLGGEDTDLAWRVHSALDRPLLFSPDTLVYHDVRRRTFSQALRETYRWAGIARVVARHPGLARRTWHRGYFFRRSHLHALLAAAGLTGSLVLPPALVLTVPWLRLKVLPGRPRRAWLTRLAFAPALLLLELVEIAVLARASLRHRTLIL